MPIQTLSRLADLDARQWDALLPDAQPFLRHAFLASLEDSGSVGPHSGWQPAHPWRSDDGRLLAALPAYVKAHSYGEYVFDWGWADACQRAGIRYYPKLLVGIPFPRSAGRACSARTRRSVNCSAPCAGQRAGRWSGVHVNFTDARADA
jgi:predicted N-acyltransferase